MSDFERAFVVIPAYNEERTITGVIEAAQSANPMLVAVEQVIVVDNNSEDYTAVVARDMGSRVVSCEIQGKGEAMDVGVEQARKLGATAVTFLDADLTNLKGVHVDALTEPVLTGETPMTAGIIDLWDNWLLPYIPWPSLSGERSISLDYWDRLSPEVKRGFYIETAINVCAIEQGWFRQIQQVRLEGVGHDHRRKLKTNGMAKGTTEYIRTYKTAFIAYSRAYLRRE